MFELDLKAKVRTQSRGQRARVGLLIAVAHRPELLVLDEPSSGLDPVVRRDVLNAIIKTVADEGRTVLFSSHLLDEIDRVADRVAMLSNGKIALEDWTDQLKSSFQRITLRYDSAPKRPPEIPGLIDSELTGTEWVCTCRVSGDQEQYSFARNTGAQIVETSILSLEEIFVINSKSRN
jgi:ABC-2 type transport system ATP-binding protein